jgi:hypothetical protein
MLRGLARAARRRVAARVCADRDERIAELEARLDHERLFPAEWANRRVRHRFGDRVLAGPFKGLEFPDWGITHVNLFAPKLLGSYELELRGAIEAAIAAAPARVVNLGAGEGYFAVGFALRLPDAHVVAFEAQTDKHDLLAQIAERNGVRDRVEIEGACDLAALRAGLEPGTLIFCDVDGAERELLDPAAIPELTTCTLIVELHDQLVPGVSALVRERFAATHEIEAIPAQERFVGDFPELGDIPLVTRQLAISEFRDHPSDWLAMTPRA